MLSLKRLEGGRAQEEKVAAAADIVAVNMFELTSVGGIASIDFFWLDLCFMAFGWAARDKAGPCEI